MCANKQAGFSLLEVLVALAILFVVLGGLIRIEARAQLETKQSEQQSRAMLILQNAALQCGVVDQSALDKSFKRAHFVESDSSIALVWPSRIPIWQCLPPIHEGYSCVSLTMKK